MTEKIIQVDYKEEMGKSYIDYAMSVITGRALPDIRDGLKPVHRRILYTMKELGNYPDKPFKKSARIVGDALGKYHPHGDSSVYDAMVRLAQDFNMLMPLVEGHGNFGSIDGDSAAAMRYTEARLSPVAMEMLQDLEKDVVDFRPNFDNTLKEPEVLPSKFPNLLVNGSSGIAVGMATNIPPHNLTEVINAAIALIDNPNITTKGLMNFIHGPDFPTGGIVANKDELLKIYDTGEGNIRIRAKLEVEDVSYGRKNVVVTEIPYTLAGNKSKLIEDMIKLVDNKKLDEVVEIRDESSKDGMRIVIEIKKGVNIDNFINKLYKLTKLEDTMSVNFLAIADGRPEIFSLKGMLEHYIEFLKEINLRKIKYELKGKKDRKEVLEGLIKATDVIDLIIEIIRGSKDVATAKKCLVKGEADGIKFKTKKSKKEASKLLFTERQADAILSMQLQRLVGLEINKLDEEYKEVLEKINYLETLINHEDELKKYIKQDLRRIRNKYGKERKTSIDNLETVYREENVIQEEDVYVLIDRFNYLKVIDEQSYVRTNEETLNDYKKVIKMKNTDNLCLFTDNGDFHQIKIIDIPISKIRDRGTPIDNLCDINKNKILLMLPLEELKHEVVFITSKGLVKRVDAGEYNTNRRTIIATRLNDDDSLIGVEALTEEDKEIVLRTENNREIRFMLDEIPLQKRNARGVVGINLNIDDLVKEYEITPETDEKKRRRGAKGAVV